MSAPAVPSGHSYDAAAISSVLAGVPTEVWVSLQNYVGAMSTPPPGSTLQIPGAGSTAVLTASPQKQKTNSASHMVVPAILVAAPALVLLI
ncbi:YALIA101S08e05534g1_1 [Yarrowia lipolytica]|nr:YALIA101S08e05534g1_1 [Yarrowia lipolytica]VBB88750.1 Hypothetical protein conserved in the Yarrowia clade [Yarrowia lipolytica]